MACSKPVKDYKEISFLFYIAKSISLEVISILKKALLWPN